MTTNDYDHSHRSRSGLSIDSFIVGFIRFIRFIPIPISVQYGGGGGFVSLLILFFCVVLSCVLLCFLFSFFEIFVKRKQRRVLISVCLCR